MLKKSQILTVSSNQVINLDDLSHRSTEELKQELLRLTSTRDTDSLNQKVRFAKNELAPLFDELSKRNPFPNAEDQVSLVLGDWTPIWSTIPFQDTIPGRIRQESYQIFHNDGYYANIARYAPGLKIPFLRKLSSILFAYDLMIVQQFKIVEGQWYIQNIGIKQALRSRAVPLSRDKAEKWFAKFMDSRLQEPSQTKDSFKSPSLANLDQVSTAKRFQKTFEAIPQLEHLYIDGDFRLVKTRREAKQRPSYTIAVRL